MAEKNKISTIKGKRRPNLSAISPKMKAPTGRIIKLATSVTAISGIDR
jgi:hypothetical protein